MSRFDVCACGNDEAALKLAEKIVRDHFIKKGEAPCAFWMMTVTNMADAIVQHVVGTCHGSLRQRIAWEKACIEAELVRSQIEVIASDIISELPFKSAP